MKKTYNDIYIDLVKDILNNGESNEGTDVRAKYADGSPAYSKSLFGVTLSYSSMPLLTLRSVPVKTATREMLAFWVNQVYDEQSFKELGMLSFWKEWILADGTIGKSYAYNHESRPEKHNKVFIEMIKFNKNDFLNLRNLNTIDESISYGNPETVKNISDDQKEALMQMWTHYIHEICSGRVNVIDKDMLNFEKFLRIARRCPQFFLAKEDNFNLLRWTLSIDYFSDDNVFDSKTIVFIKKDYTKYTTTNESGKVLRHKLSKNQVVNLINELKNNKSSKRHMVNYFNWTNQDEKSLVECCYAWHFNVSNNKLNMMLIQRSCDVFLGKVNNVYQFYVLLRMLALETGLDVGEFKHVIGDVHIYSNQEEPISELINEEPYDLPTLMINAKDDFFDYTIDDFTIVGEMNPKKYKVDVAI